MARFSAARIGAALLIAAAAVSAVVFGGGAPARVPATPLPSLGSESTEEGELTARDQWFYGQRAYPGTEIPAGALGRARAQAEELARGNRGSEAPDVVGSLTWTELGPRPISSVYSSTYPWYGQAPLSGRITAIANDPGNSSIAYIGAAAGGVWKTTNDGASWTPIFDNQPTIAVGALAIDPNNTQRIYAGTGEGNIGFNSYFGSGIYVSNNAGGSWSKLSAVDPVGGGQIFDSCYIADIVVKPGDSNTILVAAHGNGRYLSPNICSQAVWRTTNGGSTWEKVTSGSGQPSDIAVDPTNASIWYFTFSNSTAFPNGWGVYKSTNSGAPGSLVEKSTGLPASDRGRAMIAVAPSDGQRLYVVYGKASDSNVLGVYTSTTGGDSWSALSTDSGLCLSSNGQCGYDLTISVSPSSSTTFYVGGVYLYKYSGSPTPSYAKVGWGDASTPNSIHVDQHALSFDSTGRVWIGNDGGLYRTGDGATFDNLNAGLAITQFYPGTSGNAVGPFTGGAQDDGVSKYANTLSWTGLLGADGAFTAVDPANPLVIWGSTQFLATAKATDGATMNTNPACGTAWKLGANCGSVESPEFIAPIAMDPGNSQRVYAGTTRIWRTVNAGTSWSALGGGLFFGASVTAIAPAPSNPSVIYAGTENGELHVSTDDGVTWPDNSPAPFPNAWVTDIAVDRLAAGTAYVALSGFNYTAARAYNGHLLKTTNFGGSWTDVSGNLPDVPVNAVVLDTRVSPAILYVGTDVGVFWSSNDGATWQNTAGGLPNTVVMDLLLDPSDALIAATHGRGAWVAPAIGSAVLDKSGSITNADRVQTGRMTRNLPTSTCTAPTSFPGTNDSAARHYDLFKFKNSSSAMQCFMVTLNPMSCTGTNFLFSAAYSPSFDPANIATNYLADAGESPATPNYRYSFNVPANTSFDVVIHEVTAGAGCPGYALSVNGVGLTEGGPTAVGVVGFSATRRSGGALLRWRTASELTTLGYNVYREEAGARARVNSKLIRAARGAGVHVYSWLDRRSSPDRRTRYWLEAVSVNGSRTWKASARTTG